MKYLSFLLLFLAYAGAMLAQSNSITEVISEEVSYIPYEDSLLIKRTVTITETEIEGVNDTLVSFSEPTDTAGVVEQLINEYLNTNNRRAAIMRRAAETRYFLRDYNTKKKEIQAFGVELDSVINARYGNSFSGLYRVFDEKGDNYLATMQSHPTRSDMYRLVPEERGGGNGVTPVFLLGNATIRLRVGNSFVLLMWDGNNRERKVYRPLSFFLPPTEAEQSSVRLVKIR